MCSNTANRDKVIHKEISYILCGLCFNVHNQLGRFRNEKQYADALETALKDKKMTYSREFPIEVSFSGEQKRRNIVDFLVENEIIIDLKAKTLITKDDYFQMQRYLSSANKKLGIIVNFRQKYLVPKRVLNNNL